MDVSTIMASEDDTPLFADQPEWADITPLEQYDSEGLSPLAPIIYTVEYKDASNYFRAIVKKGEKSLRVLELTERMITLNAAHYTAWQYRYETLYYLLFSSSPPSPFPSPEVTPFSPPTPSKQFISITHPLISNELTLLDELGARFLKTYQVWHHRRLIVCLTGEWKRELEFAAKILGGSETRDPDWEGDAKNYHTWSHRQWLLMYFGGVGAAGTGKIKENNGDVWSGELPFVELMLSKDLRNNSAWHHRYFIVWKSGVREDEEDREHVLRRELTFVKHKISLAPNNPSAWNYLRGTLSATTTPLTSILPFVEPYTRPRAQVDAGTTVDDIIDLDNPLPSESAELPCTEALEFVADAYVEQEGISGVEVAISIWKSLAEEYDTIRKNYWQYRIRTVQARPTR